MVGVAPSEAVVLAQRPLDTVECIMCFEPLEQRYLLPDCGHTKTCLTCIEKLNRERTKLDRKCPECRQLIKAKPIRAYI